MRKRNCATAIVVCSATLVTLMGCGGSSEDSSAGNGGHVGVGGAAIGGNGATGGAKATGGASNAVTGGASLTGGNKATGGAPATGGVLSTGGVAATGGLVSTGGSKAAGGTRASTGGSTAVSDAGGNPEVEAMCSDVCALLANRNPPLECVPADCAATCNRTYTQLSSKAVCSDAYAALYECGLAQPASDWECYTVAAGTFQIDIPVPPRSANTCGTEFQTLYSAILTNLTTCGAALSW